MKYPKNGLQGNSAQKCRLASNLLWVFAGPGPVELLLSALKWTVRRRKGGTGPTAGYQARVRSGMTGSHGHVNLSDKPRGRKFPETLTHQEPFPLWNWDS